MNESNYQLMMDMKKDAVLQFIHAETRVALCPDMGGRVFAEIAGISPHRIDLDTVSNPDKPFNNYGGGNVWPAPEGGKFGFNYCGNEWYVQEAINHQPFSILSSGRDNAILQKQMTLLNRMGTVVETVMTRKFALLPGIPGVLTNCPLRAALSYETVDSFEVKTPVSVERALLAAWILEQFEAGENTLSFGIVDRPQSAINFDFYAHPAKRITYYPQGFTYRTDGQCRGQIGIKKEARALLIGFYNPSRNLLCLRQTVNPEDGLFFNIADNDQPNGPYSAADNYSIFNSDPDMHAFELETIGAAKTDSGMLRGSRLTSHTTLAVFSCPEHLVSLVSNLLGEKV